MRKSQNDAALISLAAIALFSSAAHAGLNEYSFTYNVATSPTAVSGFKPANGALVQGSFSYFSPDTPALSPVNVVNPGSINYYIYNEPSNAFIDFTIGNHHFTSDSVSVVVGKPVSSKVGLPESVAVIGLNLKMDGVAIPQGMAGFEFAYDYGTFSTVLPPTTLTVNPSAYTMGYIVQNGGYGISSIFHVAGTPSGMANVIFSAPQSFTLAVPEPGTLALMGLGLGGVAVAVGASKKRMTLSTEASHEKAQAVKLGLLLV